MKQILVIVNPAASRGGVIKALEKVRSLTREHKDYCSFDFMITENPEHATELTRSHASEHDVVAAFGGDGTVNEVVQGLVGSTTPLALIPFGTGNDFARSAGIPLNLESAINLICRGTASPCDVGFVNGRYFINAVGIGFDGRTNYEAGQIRWLRGPLAILLAILRTMRYWKAVPMIVTVDNEVISGTTYLVDIGNGSSVGGGLKLTPQARINDGILSVCHVGNISPMKIIMNFGRLKNGTVEEMQEVSIYYGSNITVESEMPMPVHVDGEVLGLEVKHLDLRILPAAIQLVREYK